MGRTCQQSLWWRAYAIFAVGFPLVMLLSKSAFSEAGANWQTLKGAYWLLAPLGVLGYAFGFRIFSTNFWRVYAVLFTIESGVRCVRFLWVKAMPLIQSPGDRNPAIALVAVALFWLTCVALLRYAELLKGGRRPPPNYSEIFS
jgi:hypothetical protein